MGRAASHLGGPPELQAAIQGYFSMTGLSTCAIYRLLRLVKEGRGDYTWGYRIYRTTYKPGTDELFAKAMDTLNEWVRDECFCYDDDNRNRGNKVNPPLDPKTNEQLWLRLRNDIIEDRGLLENASPENILKLAQDWVHLDLHAKTKDNPRYRFFLVVDDEVLNQLLNLPEDRNTHNIRTTYSIKVYDARHNSPSRFSDGECDPDTDDDDDDYNEYEDSDQPMYGYEGWFWASACKLVHLWFLDYQSDEELRGIDHSRGGVKRFLHSETAVCALPLAECLRAENS